MNKYMVYVTYQMQDHFEIEAENIDDADEIVGIIDEENKLPVEIPFNASIEDIFIVGPDGSKGHE